MTLQAHIDNQDNPHGLSLSQLGFTNLQTWPLATPEEIVAMERNDCYIDLVSAADAIQNAYNQYLFDLGLADENGNLFPPVKDVTGDLEAYVGFDELLRLSGYLEGGRKLTYTILEDGASYLTGSHDFVDAFDFTVEGTFREDRTYTTEITITDVNDLTVGTAEKEIEDRRVAVDLSDDFNAVIDPMDRLRLWGEVIGGRSLRYTITEDGAPFLSGTHAFIDTFDFYVTGNFVESSTYQVTIDIDNEGDDTIATGERVVLDLRNEDGGYFWEDEFGDQWYDQRQYINWSEVTTYDILDQGIIGEETNTLPPYLDYDEDRLAYYHDQGSLLDWNDSEAVTKPWSDKGTLGA